MPAIRVPVLFLALVLALVGVLNASAQALGTFRWQQQPFCNVVTFNVVQQGAVYQLDGFDDQCGGAASRAAATGIAVINPNGTIDLSSLSGTWRDNGGQTGSWTFLPGAGNLGGSPRPVARASFPAGISAGGSTITNLAPPVNATDAASKGYVDTVSAVDRALARTLFPLPMGAVPSAVGVKYVDTSTSSFTIDVRSYVFPEGGTRQDSSAGSSPSSNGTNGNRLQLLPLTAPAPVSASQGYYLLMTAPTYANGDMAFCGAQVTYTAP